MRAHPDRLTTAILHRMGQLEMSLRQHGYIRPMGRSSLAFTAGLYHTATREVMEEAGINPEEVERVLTSYYR
jgi:8-oxo-dGTP pyrophosphatase MutT (NUDIX family)